MNETFSRQAFQPAFGFPAAAQAHHAGTVAHSRTGTTRGAQTHRRAAPGGEYGSDGRFYPGGRFFPAGAAPEAAGPEKPQMFGQQSGPDPQQPQGGGDEASLGGGPQDDPGGGGTPGQQPDMAPQQPAIPQEMLRDRVSLYHNIGREPPHEVAAGMAWLRQPTGQLPHIDDEHSWVQLQAPPELMAGLLLHAIGASGHPFAKYFGKGLAQALGPQVAVLGEVPVQEALFVAMQHPTILDHFRCYSEDAMGKSLTESGANRVWWRATKALADNAGFGQDLGHAAAESIMQVMAPPPNPDLV